MTLATKSDDPLMTIQQLGEREGLTPRQVRYLIRKQALPTYRVNGVRIRWSEYVAWLATRKVIR